MAGFSALSALTDVLRTRDYAIYTMGNSISLIGTWVQRIATGWLTWQLTGSGLWLGAMAFADLAPTVFIGPFAGVVADRMDRLKLIRVSQALMMLIATLLFVLVAVDSITIWSLLLLTVASGMTAAFNQPARLAFIAALVPKAQLPSAVAINSIVFNTARFVGPMIAGIAIAASGVALAFALNAASFAVFLFSLSRLSATADTPAERPKGGIFGDLRAGIAYARGHYGLASLFLLMIVAGVAVRPVVELLPGFADAVFGAGATGLAALTSSIGIGAIAAGLWLGARPRPAGLPGLAVLCSAVLSLAVLAFVATDNIYLALAAMLVGGVGIAASGIALQTTIHLAVEPAMRGRILSIHGVIFRGGPALGALIMGAVSEFTGLRTPVAVGAVVMLAVSGLLALRLDRIRQSLALP
jgi:predicted MFS family arabinose efflux permease